MPKNKDPWLLWLLLQKTLRIFQPKSQGARQSPNKKSHQPRTVFRQEFLHANGLRFHHRVIDRQGVSKINSRSNSSVVEARGSSIFRNATIAGNKIRVNAP
jgi:hypothetical protein